MSKNYDSGMGSLHLQPFGAPNQRAVEYSTVSSQYISIFVDFAKDLWYNFGNGASWTSEQLTGVGMRLGLNVDVDNASLAIDQNSNHVHIAFKTTGDIIYHCECTVPLVPANNANWTAWGGNRYQRVDNTANTKGSCSIAVDGNTGNGTNSPHIVWGEELFGPINTICYNYGNGANHAFNVASYITLSNATSFDPTIVAIEPDGRDLYVFWCTTAPSIQCMRCLNGVFNPLLIANWGGPAAGAGAGPDVVLTGAVAMTAPSATWWWDMTEHVGVTAVDITGFAVKTREWDQSALPPAWTAQFTAAGYTGNAAVSYLTNIQAPCWRLYVETTVGPAIYHAHNPVGTSIDFSAGATWYSLATTVANARTLSVDWRGLERNDGGEDTQRTAAVWQDFLNNLWFSQVRQNHTPVPVQVSPAEGAYIDELVNNNIEWGLGDVDSDGQREYNLVIDDDIAFGTPLVQTGWVADVATLYLLLAATAAADKTYYWRLKVRDDQYGTEYDPYSETAAWYPTAGTWTFKTTPQCTINIIFVSQQSDKDCYITARLASEVDSQLDIVTHQYDAGGGFLVMTVIDGESTCVHNTIPVTGGVDLYYDLAWNSVANLGAAFDSTVDVKLGVQYKGNTHGLGAVEDTKNNNPLDFAAPSQVIGVPDGTVVTSYTPTLYATVADTTGYKVKFEISDQVGFVPVHQDSGGYLGVGVSQWTVTVALTHSGTWYFRAKSIDTTVSLNENVAWVDGDFTFTPPPEPVFCQHGVWEIEVDPDRTWVGNEFDVLDDVHGSVRLNYKLNAPHELEFTLNNANGRYMDPSSEFRIRRGDEVRMTRGSHSFFGKIKNVSSETSTERLVTVYCESFSGAADSFPIQMRLSSTSVSSLYAEDYIKLLLMSSGLMPKWFSFVDASGNQYYLESHDNKVPLLSESDIVYDKVTLVEALNDLSSRTGRVWWEGRTAPTGRKAYLYWTDPANPIEGTASQTFYLESDIIRESLTYDEDSLVNRVVFSDADVIEQDMDSIREYGVHTTTMSAVGSTEKERLIEIAQYIISQRSTPRASGTIPLEGEVDLNLNDLVRIYEETSDDVKTGFSGNYTVVAIEYIMAAEGTTTNLTLTSRWEDPLVKRVQEMLRSKQSSSDPIVQLRVETAEVRVECPTNGVGMTTEAADLVGRIGIDRVSDTVTDADYYTVYGGP